MKPITPPYLRSPLVRRRGGAAVLASAMAFGCALPVATATGENLAVSGSALAVLDDGGNASELTGKVTLAQLASLLGIGEAELIVQIEALPGNATISVLLNGLLANPHATLQNLFDELTANGLNPSSVKQLLQSLLGPAVANPEALRGVISTLLFDLGLDGQLGSLASQLNVPVGTLEVPDLKAVSTETLAQTLHTTIADLSALLSGAGAITQPLTGSTPLVATPLVTSAGEAAQLIGVPDGLGGITLTTVGSNPQGPAGDAGASGAAGANGVTSPAGTPPASVNNAFSIVSVKLTKGGLILETVRLPRAGRLTVKGSAKGRVATAARRHKKAASKSIKIGSAATNAGAGTRTITLHPGRAIKGARSVVVSLTTTYAPTGGASSTKHTTVTFKRTAKRQAARKG